MKVVIANPPWPGEGYGTRSNIRWPHRRGDKVLTFPIYLAYAASILNKANINVIAIDAIEKEFDIDSFVNEIKRIDPKIVFLEISTPSIYSDLEIAEKLKTSTNALISFMGPHATYFHKELIENYRFIDFCIRNEFEYTIRDLCLALKENKSFDEVLGITYRKDSKVIINKNRSVIENLDELPFPDRIQFKLENYQQAFYGGKKTALLIASRGCPYNCTFCLWPDTLYGHKHRERSAKNIVDEIELLITDYGVDEIYFDDDSFTISKAQVLAICNELKSRNIGIPWLCMGRVNNVDEEMLNSMKESGCKEIFYGFESGSQEILNHSYKNITLEQIKKAVELTKKTGICAGGSFVFGLQKESMKTVKETIRFAKKLGANYVQFTLASPFPGTKLYEEVKEKNLLKLNSWADLDGTKGPIIETEFLSKKQLSGVIRKAYLQYYTSPRIIIQNLKAISDMNSFRKIMRGAFSVLSRVFYYKK